MALSCRISEDTFVLIVSIGLVLVAGSVLATQHRASYDGPVALEMPVTSFSVDLHIHGSFSEGRASMESQTLEAEQMNVDALWWTDHDSFFTHFHDITAFGFESFSEFRWEGEDWSPLTPDEVSAKKSVELDRSEGMEAFAAILTGDEVWEGESSLLMSGSNDEPEFAQFYYTLTAPPGANRQRQHTVASGLSVAMAVFPELVGEDARASIEIEMSHHDQTAESHVIHYHLEPDPLATPFLVGNTYYVPLSFNAGAWNLYTLEITDDAVDAFGIDAGEDNGMHALRFGVESRLGQEARVYFDGLQIAHDLGYPELFTKQRTMLDGIQSRLPNVGQLQGSEISDEIHMNDYSVGTELPDYQLLAEIGGFVGDDGLVEDVDGFQEFVANFVSDEAERRGGQASLAHPFGSSRGSIGGSDQVEVRDKLIAAEAYGAHLLEVGYLDRGGHPLANHLWLWDELAKAELFMLGVGASDSHYSFTGSTKRDSFVTWIYADQAAKPELIDGMKRGWAFFARPNAFQGSVSLTTTSGFLMGQIVVTDRLWEDVTFEIDGLQGGEEIRTILGGTLFNSHIASGASFALTESVPIDTDTFYRVEVWGTDGKGTVFTNPIYFEKRVPSAGLRHHRAAIDMLGVRSTLVDGLALSDVRARELGGRALLRIKMDSADGTLILDPGAFGGPRDVRFSGLTGSWEFTDGLVILSELQGEGAVRIVWMV